MIKVVYGPKGSGKTVQMINAANAVVEKAKGHIIFITDTTRSMFDLSRQVRCINSTEYNIAGETALCAFVKGVIAGNYDNEYIFIDGVSRISGKPVAEMAAFFFMLDKAAAENNLTITVSFTAEEKDLPDFVKKYL